MLTESTYHAALMRQAEKGIIDICYMIDWALKDEGENNCFLWHAWDTRCRG